MTTLFEWFGGKINREAQKRTHLRIAAENVLLPGKPAVAAIAEQHYVRLWLVEMFLRQDRSWFTSRHPLVYSLAALQYGDGGAEISGVSGKKALNVDQVDLGRSIGSHYALTPVLPFRGGTVSVDCGLVSMKSADVIEAFAGVVSDFAGKLCQPQVASVVGLAGSVASGIQGLLGAGEAVTELYYRDTFGGASGGAALESGYVFLSDQPDGTWRPDQLWVTPQGLRCGLRSDPRPLPPQDYLLIEVQVTDRRDDFRAFSAIKEPFDQALEAKLDGEAEKAELLRRQALKAAARSPDLTALDKKRVAEAIRLGFDADGWVADPATESGLIAPGGRPAVADAFERAVARVGTEAAARLPAIEDTLARLESGAPDLRSVSRPRASAAEGAAVPAASPRPRGGSPRPVTGKRTEPLAKASPFESILGVDERTRVTDTRNAPWRMICSLDITGPWGGFVGTGWFAGPRTIVTAGHCVHDANQMGGWATRIVVRPGRDGDAAPQEFTATHFSASDRWLSAQDPDFDYAAIHLDPVQGRSATDWFRVAALDEDGLRDAMVNVSGYPADRGGGKEQWWARNRIRAVTPRRIFYDVDTMGGQSGAPAFLVPQEGAAPVVVGVHAYGVGATPAELRMELNSAPRIIPEVADLIGGWVRADGGTGAAA